MTRILAELSEVGPFFTGNTAPSILGILSWDAGGYVDLTGATVKFVVYRWDPVRREPVGGLVMGATCVLGIAQQGEVYFHWISASPIATVPRNPGWYCGRFVVTFPDTKVQDSQTVVFEVRKNLPTV